MKKQLAICMLFLTGTAFSVAAHPVTVKSHFATECTVSKTQHDVMFVAAPMEFVFEYTASENRVFVPFIAPAITDKPIEAFGLFNRVRWHKSSNYKKDNTKTKRIYLQNCSIRQCISRPLNRSVSQKNY